MEQEEIIHLDQAKSPFETERIGKLIAKFAIPSIISLLVSSLYNIVDQIFIGQGVGYLGNAATNVAFPFVTLTLAVGLLIGDGAAANFSLHLGKGQPEISEKCVGNTITMSAIVSILFMLVGFLFTDPLLHFLGATEKSLPYAQEYIRIILIGFPFWVMGIGIGTLIRADGSPKYAMISMLAGAITNVILDPVFIFVCNWGVGGAAFATILGQIVTFVISIFYFKKFKTVKPKIADCKLDFQVVRRICSLGISSFITQVAIAVVMIVMNNILVRYGTLSKYGPDIPLAALGIVMKVNQIMCSIIIGTAAGTQPIVGFNYGARNYKRVKKTFLISVGLATMVSIVFWVLFQTCTQGIINIFGQEEALYNEFAQKCFHIFLSVQFFTGFQISAGIFFQAIGKPVKAAATSLSRQILFLVPLLIILPIYMGIEGALYAGPVADTMAFLLSFILILFEIRKLNRQAIAADLDLLEI